MYVKRDFGIRHNAPLALITLPHITISSFVAHEAWRQNIIYNLHAVANNTQPFTVILHDFGTFHHTIYINVRNVSPFMRLTQLLRGNKHTSQYLSTKPHLTICRQLEPVQHKCCWPEYAQRTFRSSFTASGMLLLERQQGKNKFREAAYFTFNANCPTCQQGTLF